MIVTITESFNEIQAKMMEPELYGKPDRQTDIK